MNFEFDLASFESLMLMYIGYSAVLWVASHVMRFIR